MMLHDSVRPATALPSIKNGDPISDRVIEILPKLSSDSSLEIQNQGASELAAFAEQICDSRTFRGTSRHVAQRQIDAYVLDEVYAIFEASPLPVQMKLLPAISAFGDKNFLPVVDRMTRSGINDSLFRQCVYTLGRLGGTNTLEWLAVQALTQIGSNQAAVNLTMQELLDKRA